MVGFTARFFAPVCLTAALLVGGAPGISLASTPAGAAGSASWELQLPGISHHFSAPLQQGKSWNEFHDGLGLQRTEVRPHFVWRAAAGFMRDSFGNQGLYAGASIGYRLHDGALAVDAAAAPMLLYRSTRFDDARGDAPMRLIPIVMPMLTVEHKASGIGVNITALPGGRFGKELHFPGLVYMQITYRVG
jgi:hypothetical protein